MLYAWKGAGMLSLYPSLFLPLALSLPLSLSLTGEEGVCGMLYACKGVHTLFTGQRKSEREKEREKERERERDSEREKESE